MEVDAYRMEAEAFLVALATEQVAHFSGRKRAYEIGPIYERHAQLFSRETVAVLHEAARVPGAGVDERRRARLLLQFAVEGFLGHATRALDAELAEREARLTITVGGTTMPYRESAVAQANEPDAERRAAIEAARLAVLSRELNPLLAEALETTHGLATELGWASYRGLCEDLGDLDLESLGARTAAFLAGTENPYAEVLDPELRRTVGVGLDELRRADIPRFFRDAPSDRWFPAPRLLPSLEETIAALELPEQMRRRIRLDVERRPAKSPRAFCSAVRVPDEVHLVISPVGGRDDTLALLHEAGHALHFAAVDPGLPFEFRRLGDATVTEAFAFLFEHLAGEPEWLRLRLGVDEEAAEVVAGGLRAQRLLYVRRYAAKLAYELELHAGTKPIAAMAPVYAERLSSAVRVDWPQAPYLADVDPGFYAASYLRAWAVEARLRTHLREHFGPVWFEEPEAGSWLARLWAEGQRFDGDELLEVATGETLDFGVLLEDLGLAA